MRVNSPRRKRVEVRPAKALSPAITEIAIRELFGYERLDIRRIEERIACLLLHVGQGFDQPRFDCSKLRVVGEIIPFVRVALEIVEFIASLTPAPSPASSASG